jgi:hypothetical protein
MALLHPVVMLLGNIVMFDGDIRQARRDGDEESFDLDRLVMMAMMMVEMMVVMKNGLDC